jgi:hypothetical protein
MMREEREGWSELRIMKEREENKVEWIGNV